LRSNAGHSASAAVTADVHISVPEETSPRSAPSTLAVISSAAKSSAIPVTSRID
jgi:hypothetical protein